MTVGRTRLALTLGLLTSLFSLLASAGEAFAATPAVSPGEVAPKAPPMAAESAPADSAAAELAAAQLWLSGPFGRVGGGPLDAPAGAAPHGSPLDTFVLRAPLQIDDGAVDDAIGELSVRAVSDESGAVDERLSSGRLAFEGPSSPGLYTVVAEGLDADGEWRSHAWLITVPDHVAPDDTFLDIPAPVVIVETAGGAVSGNPGNGCYLYLCVDVGRPTPPELLELIRASPGETLAIRLSDGSAIAAWQGVLEPQPGTDGSAHKAEGATDDPPSPIVELVGLEAPPAGAWLLRLKIDFDRERGWIESHYRLTTE